MPIQSNTGLFQVLEKELRKAGPKNPLDCATLFDKASVRQHAETVNRVSDYLGNLWRKGKVLRLPAPRVDGTKARWLYVWNEKHDEAQAQNRPDLSKAIGYDAVLDGMLNKPVVHMSDDGRVVKIATQFCVITIEQRARSE